MFQSFNFKKGKLYQGTVNNIFLDSFSKASMCKEFFKGYDVVKLKDQSWSHLPKFLSIFSRIKTLEF